MKYKTFKKDDELHSVIIREDNAIIPIDSMNSDYQEYLAWVAEGNEAQPWE
jgi:hypothetical protein